MSHRRPVILKALSILGVLALLAGGVYSLAVWRRGLTEFRHVPRLVMGTSDVLLTAVLPRSEEASARRALRAAEAELRRVEARMSRRLESSEIAHLNAAGAGETVPLSPQTLDVLRTSRDVWRRSGGAFDVTIRPMILLWMRAKKDNQPPSDEQLAAARGASSWEQLQLTNAGAVKLAATASVDLGGIAKGCGIDAAVESLRNAGCAGGLVNVGGDIRCFGPRPDGGEWRVAVRDPFDPEGKADFAVLKLSGLAVCTSGNYFRYSEIAGMRYSHILDPATGRPVDEAPSVTVVAPTATIADAWATALSVLGPRGLELLPDDVEAMIVTGGAKDYRLHTSPGFDKLLLKAPQASSE